MTHQDILKKHIPFYACEITNDDILKAMAEAVANRAELIDRLNKMVNDQAIQLAAKDKKIAELEEKISNQHELQRRSREDS